MSSFKWCLLGAFFAGSLLSTSEAAMVTFDASNRPTSITELEINSAEYEATIVYNAVFNHSDHSIKDLPFDDIGLAFAAVSAALQEVGNTAWFNISPSLVQIEFLANDPVPAPLAGAYRTERRMGLANGTLIPTDQPGPPTEIAAAFNLASNEWGAISFTEVEEGMSPVPEPSSAILLGMATFGCLLYRRQKSILIQRQTNPANA